MYIFFLIITALTTLPIFSRESQPAIDKSMAAVDKINFVLPLYSFRNKCSILSVSIPEGYKPLQSLEQFGRREATMIEYIPKEESANEWSKIITLNKLIGKRTQAGIFTNSLKSQVSASSSSRKVLSQGVSKEKMIEKAHFIMQYQYQNRQEVLGAFYFSGPSDLAGVQYTIRLKKDQTVADAVSQIEAFFENQVKCIVDSP